MIASGAKTDGNEAYIMKTMDQNAFAQQNVFGLGTENTAYARYFSGQSFLNPLTKPESGLFLANVTFEPGCRKMEYSL